MVTFAQAQERAEEWVNGDVPAYQHREVRVREFGLGFVVWGEDRPEGPRSDAGGQRLVIARDSGEATLWPALPVGEVIRRYEEEYGREAEVADAVPAPAARVDLNQTSFLLSPPEWLQEAADKLGIPDRRPGADAETPVGLAETQAGVPAASGGAGAGAGAGVSAGVGAGAPNVPAGATPWAGTDTNADAGDDRSVPLPATVFAPPLSDADDGALGDAETALMAGGSQLPPTAVSPALDGTETPAGAPGAPGTPPGSSTPPPSAQSYGYPQAPSAPGTPPPGAPGYPQAPASQPPAPSYGYPQGPGAPGYGYPQAPQPPAAPAAPATPAAPSRPLAPNAGDIADAATSRAAPPPRRARGGAGAPPPPPGAPGTPGAYPGGAPQPPAPGGPVGGYVPTQMVSSLGPEGPDGPAGAAPTPGAPNSPGAPGTPPGTPPGDAHRAATMLADPNVMGGGAPGAPNPPGAPGAPSAPRVPPAPGAPQPPSTPGAPSAPFAPGAPQAPGTPGAPSASGAPQAPGAPGGPGGPQPPGVPGAPGARFAPGAPQAPGAPFAPGAPQAPGAPGAPAAPGAPQPPGAPGMPPAPARQGTPQGAPQASAGGAGGAVHHAETVLAAPPVNVPGGYSPPPPPAPGAPHAPGVPHAPGAPGMPTGAPQAPPSMPAGAMPPPPGQPVPGQQPPAYGYPQQGQPTVGPGYQAVLRYRAQDGSEQQLIRRSAPGTPHPEWQIFHELRAMNVPPDQVLELHTELESCELPGAYCARMIREQWPQARLASIAPYGTDHASRQQGMRQLLAHQGELHQVAAGPARPAPVRAPLPPVQAAPPIPPEAIAQELAAAFGPGVFRFEQAAVDRQGVPPVVAHTLVAAGLPLDMGPFFWAQAQPGRPVPTLAELAQERGVRPSPDAASYLVMGTDFGKALCVQYGTANIVAVPVEAGPGGASVAPQFVNTGLPEFARCLALLGRMWRLRFGLNQEQAGRWTVDFQAQLASLDPAALGSPESWWSVLLEQMWDGLL
ncbi:SUKH-4 family immunity protein [Streptomyces sp. NPDC051985]|uniref:SUKH-4 family immunity protein n=1 Tax=Streptomyces sp. NPDC051985 TaxID=3155807 RepID=UPI00343F93FC